MVYDASRGVIVLYGGSSNYGDHWEWDGSKLGWVHISACCSFRWNRVVYDEARHRTVRIGNGDPTREWDGRNWMTTAGPVTPPRAWHAVAYDSARRRVVLFGGAYASIRPNDTWEYYPSTRGSTTKLGFGCAGTAGIPTIAADGPPIIGNSNFRIRIGSAKPNSPAFVGLALKPATLSIGGCTLYLDVSSSLPILIAGQSNGTGVVDLGIPIPFNPALSGFRIETQGFVHDANGTFFGGLAFTPGLRLVIGD